MSHDVDLVQHSTRSVATNQNLKSSVHQTRVSDKRFRTLANIYYKCPFRRY